MHQEFKRDDYESCSSIFFGETHCGSTFIYIYAFYIHSPLSFFAICRAADSAAQHLGPFSYNCNGNPYAGRQTRKSHKELSFSQLNHGKKLHETSMSCFSRVALSVREYLSVRVSAPSFWHQHNHHTQHALRAACVACHVADEEAKWTYLSSWPGFEKHKHETLRPRKEGKVDIFGYIWCIIESLTSACPLHLAHATGHCFPAIPWWKPSEDPSVACLIYHLPRWWSFTPVAGHHDPSVQAGEASVELFSSQGVDYCYWIIIIIIINANAYCYLWLSAQEDSSVPPSVSSCIPYTVYLSPFLHLPSASSIWSSACSCISQNNRIASHAPVGLATRHQQRKSQLGFCHSSKHLFSFKSNSFCHTKSTCHWNYDYTKPAFPPGLKHHPQRPTMRPGAFVLLLRPTDGEDFEAHGDRWFFGGLELGPGMEVEHFLGFPIENGPFSSLIYLLKTVIFNSYVSLPQNKVWHFLRTVFFNVFSWFHMFWGVSHFGCEHDLISTNPASKPQDASRCFKMPQDASRILEPIWPPADPWRIGFKVLLQYRAKHLSDARKFWETHHLRCKFTSNSSPCDTVNQVVTSLYIIYQYMPFKVSNFSRWFPDFHFKASKFSRWCPDFQIFWCLFLVEFPFSHDSR